MSMARQWHKTQTASTAPDGRGAREAALFEHRLGVKIRRWSRESAVGLHPCDETRKLETGCIGTSLRPPRGSRKLVQVCFELGRRPLSQGRVQPLTIVDVFEADRLAGVVEIAIIAAVDLIVLERL